MAVPESSDPVERAQLTANFAEFRTSPEEEIDAVQCAGRPATGDGARAAR
jgi:hypothetical protein